MKYTSKVFSLVPFVVLGLMGFSCAVLHPVGTDGERSEGACLAGDREECLHLGNLKLEMGYTRESKRFYAMTGRIAGKLCDEGDMGECYHAGRYREACDGGNMAACMSLGFDKSGSDRDGAYRLYKKACDGGEI